MYIYKFTDEESKKIADRANLFEKFKEVDDKYKVDQTPLTLEKMEYSAPSADEVEKSAKSSLEGYLTSGKDKIENDYVSKIENLSLQQESKKNANENQKLELENSYSKLKTNASNDMIRRGLARSSIAINILDAFDKDMIEKYNQLDKEYSDSFQKLESEKDLLEKQKNSALSAFDITYASKLNDKIEEINKEIEKKQTEVLKYNNDIAEKEEKYRKQLEDRNKSMLNLLAKYGTQGMANIKQDEKYALALDFFNNLPKDQAMHELMSNKTYKEQLGDKYFKKLQEVLA